MKVHHLNLATMRPYSERLLQGQGSWTETARIVTHCLLIEASDELILVDTGIGTRDIQNPRRLGWIFPVMNPDLNFEETAMAQIQSLGYDPEDVRHIIMTHLDVDHTGGLADFPHAKVHLMNLEYERSVSESSWHGMLRHRPQHWDHEPHWIQHNPGFGQKWFGFSNVVPVESVGDDLLMIPLPGHSDGHAGVAVKSDGKWLLHCGDAYFHHAEMNRVNPICPLGLRIQQRMIETQPKMRIKNQNRLRDLKAENRGDVEIFCSHDPSEFERYQSSQ